MSSTFTPLFGEHRKLDGTVGKNVAPKRQTKAELAAERKRVEDAENARRTIVRVTTLGELWEGGCPARAGEILAGRPRSTHWTAARGTAVHAGMDLGLRMRKNDLAPTLGPILKAYDKAWRSAVAGDGDNPPVTDWEPNEECPDQPSMFRSGVERLKMLGKITRHLHVLDTETTLFWNIPGTSLRLQGTRDNASWVKAEGNYPPVNRTEWVPIPDAKNLGFMPHSVPADVPELGWRELHDWKNTNYVRNLAWAEKQFQTWGDLALDHANPTYWMHPPRAITYWSAGYVPTAIAGEKYQTAHHRLDYGKLAEARGFADPVEAARTIVTKAAERLETGILPRKEPGVTCTWCPYKNDGSCRE